MVEASSTTIKQKQPFPVLPAYPAALTVLIFFGWDVASLDLLQRLSKATRRFSEAHREVLEKNLPRIVFQKMPCLTLSPAQFKPKKRGGKVSGFQWPSEATMDLIRQRNVPMGQMRIQKIEIDRNYSMQIEGVGSYSDACSLLNGSVRGDRFDQPHSTETICAQPSDQEQQRDISASFLDIEEIRGILATDKGDVRYADGFQWYEALSFTQRGQEKEENKEEDNCVPVGNRDDRERHVHIPRHYKVVGFHGELFDDRWILKIGPIVAASSCHLK